MCYDQLNILNPTTRYKSSVSPISTHVPCGKCEFCRSSAQNDWFIRAYAEFVANQERGGVTVFITLTYRNIDLPRFDKYGFDSCVSCFDKADIDTFIKNLHHYIALKYGHSEGLRYLVCCEYGSHTKRPHYHVLLFFPPLGLISNQSIKWLCEKSWSHGWILYSKEEKGGMRIRNDKGIKYVCKYVTKDLNYYALPQVVALSAEMKKYKDYPEDSPERAKLRKFKQLLPRHYQSKLFGYEVLKRCFVDYVDDDGNYLLSADIETAIKKGYRIPCTTQVYAIPRYVLNRLCYDTDSKGYRHVNKVGREVLTMVLNNRINQKAQKLFHDLSVLGIESMVPSNLTTEVMSSPDAPAKFSATHPAIVNSKVLHDYVIELLQGRTYMHLALYDVVFRNRSAQGFLNDIEYIGMSDELTLDNLDQVADKLIFETYHNIKVTRDYPEDTPPAMKRKQVRAYEQAKLFNNFPIFEGFDAILAIYETLKRYSAEHRTQGRYVHNSRVDNLRDKLNSYNILRYVS